MKPRPHLVGVTELETSLGTLRGYSFYANDGDEVVAVVRGHVWGRENVAVGINTGEGSVPPSTALATFEHAIVLHIRSRTDRRDDERSRLALTHAITRHLGVRSFRLVCETPMTRMKKR